MSGVVVVDASVAVKWVLQEVRTAEARALAAQWATQQVQPIAPGWFACEVSNVLYRRILTGDLTIDDALQGLTAILNAVSLQPIDESAVASRAIELAHLLNRPQSYDTQYLALAERMGCELWTADERFWNAAHSQFPQVRWLGQSATT